MMWRKRWARTWETVRYCSRRCARRGVNRTDRALQQTILRLLEHRPAGRSICPSEAARAVNPDGWRRLMEPARRAARRLVSEGRLEMTQSGRMGATFTFVELCVCFPGALRAEEMPGSVLATIRWRVSREPISDKKRRVARDSHSARSCGSWLGPRADGRRRPGATCRIRRGAARPARERFGTARLKALLTDYQRQSSPYEFSKIQQVTRSHSNR